MRWQCTNDYEACIMNLRLVNFLTSRRVLMRYGEPEAVHSLMGTIFRNVEHCLRATVRLSERLFLPLPLDQHAKQHSTTFNILRHCHS